MRVRASIRAGAREKRTREKERMCKRIEKTKAN